MKELKLYRKRLIPKECILLKDDVVEYRDEDMLVTSWKTLNPKTTFSHGCSCYFLNEGLKLSKFYRADESLLYYYCDIVEYDINEEENTIVVTDLLADVIIYPDGSHDVVDLDELADAYELSLLTQDQLLKSLRRLNSLLCVVQGNTFPKLLTKINDLGL